MSFAAPALLSLLLIGLPIVGLYLLRVRRRRQTVAYLRLWESLVTETRVRSMFQRLKRWLSLLVQLAILALVVLALGQPSFEVADSEKEHVVLLLDTSASMQTREGDAGTRFDLLMAEARQRVEERSFEDSMMIVAVSDRIDVLCPFTRNTLQLREALDQAAVTNRALEATRALAFAKQVTADKDTPRIQFLSDGGAGAVQRALAELELDADASQLVPLGEETENVGVVRFSVRRNTSLGTDYVLAVVKNFGTKPRECRLELALNGATQKVIPRTLAPGEEVTERFQLTLPDGGVLRLSTGVEDALPVDDTAYAVVRPQRLRRVLLVTETASQAVAYRIAFASMRQLIDPSSAVVTAAEVATVEATDLEADVTVVHGAVPVEAIEALPASRGRGNLILVNTDLPPSLPASQVGVEAQPQVWDWDRDHLLNRYMNYRDLPLPPARTIELSAGTRLVQSYEGPLMAAFDQNGRRTIYVAFDLTARLFPFRLAFPMLLRNAIAWFEVEDDVLFEETYRPGEVIAPLRRLPGNAVIASFVRGGERVEEVLALTEGRFFFTGTAEPGPIVFTVGDDRFATCVNLFEPGESNVAPDTTEDPAAGPVVTAEAGLFNRELWPLLVLLALLLWAAEWATYHRRLTE